jgi:hypothetical protein
MRTVRRPRRYVHRHWLLLMRPLLRYSEVRDAYVLRVVGRRTGPVLRPDRRTPSASRRFDGMDRRGVHAA